MCVKGTFRLDRTAAFALKLWGVMPRTAELEVQPLTSSCRFEAGKDYAWDGHELPLCTGWNCGRPILGDLPGAGDEPCDHPQP